MTSTPPHCFGIPVKIIQYKNNITGVRRLELHHTLSKLKEHVGDVDRKALCTRIMLAKRRGNREREEGEEEERARIRSTPGG